MNKNTNFKEVLELIEGLKKLTFMDSFSEEIIDFINTFSKKLLASEIRSKYPELTVLGFWLRKSNILKIKRNFENENQNKILVPQGLIFQIPPSNVTSILIYTWVLSLLTGNKNIIRLSNNKTEQFNYLISLINNLSKDKKWSGIFERNKFINYRYDEQINQFLSSNCDARVVWGGDGTVNKFRTYQLNPNSKEINFPDKISLCVINIDKFSKLHYSEKLKITELFMNDSFWFNQMACSSPRCIIWLSDKKSLLNETENFWENLAISLKKNQTELSIFDNIQKKITIDRLVVEDESFNFINEKNPLITRVNFGNPKMREDLFPGSGFFYESYINSLDEILPLINKKIQTVSYFGINSTEWKEFISKNKPNGIDRIVPIGKSLDFDIIWDGIDLLRCFSREITII